MSSNAALQPWPAQSRALTREALVCAGAATALAAALAWLGPPGSDMAAHAYQRTLFLEHGFSLWNNYWYAGRYSFVTYSLLYYPLAAVVGIRLLAVVSVATAALAFAIVTWREWGPTTRWSSRAFAMVWGGIVLAAAFPFALGVAFVMLSLEALQARAQRRFVVVAALALAASPLAFGLLALIAAGVALGKRVDVRTALVPAVALMFAVGIEFVLWRIFPDNGRYPFSTADLIASSMFGLAGAALLWRVERARALQRRSSYTRWRASRPTSCRRPSARTSRDSSTSRSRLPCSSSRSVGGARCPSVFSQSCLPPRGTSSRLCGASRRTSTTKHRAGPTGSRRSATCAIT